MKMWAVIGGHDYEGEVFSSLQLFHDTIKGEQDAKQAYDSYRKHYDYAEIELIEVQ